MPRRLMGIDLAWGELNGTGCAELVWRGPSSVNPALPTVIPAQAGIQAD